jgi:hypothetical protein
MFNQVIIAGQPAVALDGGRSRMVFKRINTTNQDLQLIQDNIYSALTGTGSVVTITTVSGKPVYTKSTSNPPFSGGNTIVTSLTASQDNLVPHFLTYTPTIWVVTRLDADTNVWEVPTTKLSNDVFSSRSVSDQYINLWCNSNCNISVWFR